MTLAVLRTAEPLFPPDRFSILFLLGWKVFEGKIKRAVVPYRSKTLVIHFIYKLSLLLSFLSSCHDMGPSYVGSLPSSSSASAASINSALPLNRIIIKIIREKVWG